jgi:hypothetical protein
MSWYGGFWDYWSLYHKVTFDPTNKFIVVNPGVVSLDMKIDVYSDWKEWVQQEDYSKFLPAFRSIGGDPVGPGLYAGDVYFLINGWKIFVDHEVAITGVVYADDGSNPFITPASANVVRSTASNLALAYGLTGSQEAQNALIQSLLSIIQTQTDDLYQEAFGRWAIDFNANTLSLYRTNGTLLQVFNLSRSNDQPPNYVERVPA